MGVVQRVYSDQTVWNFVESEFDGPDWGQAPVSPGSSNSKITSSFTFEGHSVVFRLEGSFPGEIANISVLQELSLNTQATVSAFTIDLDGKTTETASMSTPVALSELLNVLYQTDRAALQNFYSGDDVFYGSDIPHGDGDDDGVNGYGGNDTFYGNVTTGTGNNGDKFYGGDGIDTLVLRGQKDQYQISGEQFVWMPDNLEGIGRSITDNIGGRDGQKTIRTVERLQFSDKHLALDTEAGGNALETMQFIGVVAPGLKDQLDIRGLILSFFDQGYSMVQLSQLALDIGLLPTSSNALAGTVYANVIGIAPDKGTADLLVDYIDQNGHAQFLAAVAGLNINIDLVGLQQNGMEYIA
jgi:hypothetical protein